MWDQGITVLNDDNWLDSIRYDSAVSKAEYVNDTVAEISTAVATKDLFPEYKKKENQMIKNQKVVNLYFQRKFDKLKITYDEKASEIIKEDPNKKFVETLKSQFDEYIKDQYNLSTCKFNVSIPDTQETDAKLAENMKEYEDECKKLKELRTEIEALLSGCSDYWAEMDILASYGIVQYTVGDDNKRCGTTVKMNE